MLERMEDFFSSRIDGYDEHMLRDIEGASEFYPYTASLLPPEPGTRILDLGAGTGLELEYYYGQGGCASITCIDMCPEMLEALALKFPGKDIKTVCASYLDIPFGENRYDAAVSVESLHHFTEKEKLSLYRKLHSSLKMDGQFILTDYFASSPAEEDALAAQYLTLREQQGIEKDVICHFDTPFTVYHETSVLLEAGFSGVEILRSWAATYTLRAVK